MNTSERQGWTSASNAEADSLCHGRHLAQRDLPEVASDDAEHGRAIHAALAGEDVTLTLEQRDIVDSCRAIEARLVAQFFGQTKPVIRREQRYWADMGIWRHSGQPDAVYAGSGRGLVVDYKSLLSDVSASPRNLQLRDLACLVRKPFLLVEVGTVIIQPLATHSPEICLYQEADLKRSTDEMFQRVIVSNTPSQSRTPGETQCKYCRARNQCLEYQQWAGALLPSLASATKKFMMDWTPAERGLVAEQLPIAEKLLEDIKSFLKDCLNKDPDSVDGYCLKNGATRETVNNPQVVFDRLAQLGGTLEQFMPCVTVAKGKLKEVVAGVTGAKGMALNKAMDALVAGCVETKQNAPSLAKRKE